MRWWRYTHGGNRDQGFFLLHKNPRKEEQAGRQLPGGDFTARAGEKNFPEKSNGPEHLNDLVSLSAGELRPREDLLPCAWRSFPSRRRPRCGRPPSGGTSTTLPGPASSLRSPPFFSYSWPLPRCRCCRGEEEIRAGFANNKTNERRIFEGRRIYTTLLVF